MLNTMCWSHTRTKRFKRKPNTPSSMYEPILELVHYFKGGVMSRKEEGTPQQAHQPRYGWTADTQVSVISRARQTLRGVVLEVGEWVSRECDCKLYQHMHTAKFSDICRRQGALAGWEAISSSSYAGGK